MRNALLPFSTGPRACVGLNLAWVEVRRAAASSLIGQMRIVLATLIRRYRFVRDPSYVRPSLAWPC